MRHSQDVLTNVYAGRPTDVVGSRAAAIAARHFCFDVAIARIIERRQTDADR